MKAKATEKNNRYLMVNISRKELEISLQNVLYRIFRERDKLDEQLKRNELRFYNLMFKDRHETKKTEKQLLQSNLLLTELLLGREHDLIVIYEHHEKSRKGNIDYVG